MGNTSKRRDQSTTITTDAKEKRKRRKWRLSQLVVVGVKGRLVGEVRERGGRSLTTETVEGAALALEGVHHIKGGHGLAAGVLGVGDRVTDDILKEDLKDTTGLLVDQARDTLDTTPTSEAADGGLGDTLDVVAEDLAVALGPTLSESLTALATSRHD